MDPPASHVLIMIKNPEWLPGELRGGVLLHRWLLAHSVAALSVTECQHTVSTQWNYIRAHEHCTDLINTIGQLQRLFCLEWWNLIASVKKVQIRLCLNLKHILMSFHSFSLVRVWPWTLILNLLEIRWSGCVYIYLGRSDRSTDPFDTWAGGCFSTTQSFHLLLWNDRHAHMHLLLRISHVVQLWKPILSSHYWFGSVTGQP